MDASGGLDLIQNLNHFAVDGNVFIRPRYVSCVCCTVAVQATSSGHITVEVSRITKRRSVSNLKTGAVFSANLDCLRFRIVDTGCGFGDLNPDTLIDSNMRE